MLRSTNPTASQGICSRPGRILEAISLGLAVDLPSWFGIAILFKQLRPPILGERGPLRKSGSANEMHISSLRGSPTAVVCQRSVLGGRAVGTEAMPTEPDGSGRLRKGLPKAK